VAGTSGSARPPLAPARPSAPANRLQQRAGRDRGHHHLDHPIGLLLDHAVHERRAPHGHGRVQRHHEREGQQEGGAAVLALAALGELDALEVERAVELAEQLGPEPGALEALAPQHALEQVLEQRQVGQVAQVPAAVLHREALGPVGGNVHVAVQAAGQDLSPQALEARRPAGGRPQLEAWAPVVAAGL
jgi:hypothetical protein